MAEAQNSQPRPSRLYCENDQCNKPRKHFCNDHDEVLCNGCFAALHVRCKCDEIPDKEDVVECFDIAKTLLATIKENSDVINARSYIKNFDEEFQMYVEKLAEIDKKRLQKTLIESNLFTEFTKLKELKLIAAGNNLSRQIAKDIERCLKQKNLLVYKEKVFKEMEQNNQRKIKQKVKEESLEAILKLQNRIQEEEKISQNLITKNSQLSEELKEQAEELEKERQKIADMAAELGEWRQREEQENMKRVAKFIEIYEHNSELKIESIPDFCFTTDLADSKQKALFTNIVSSKLRLPDIKRIKINMISDCDEELANFLESCLPTRLKLLCINSSFISRTPVKANFYLNSLLKAVNCVTREVFIRLFEFSSEDLQQLVKAAHKVEKIVLSACSIHCSSDLDFGATTKYNTKCLSFWECGKLSIQELTTDWKENPSCFSHIVDAIGNSGLRYSLTELNIRLNETLNIAEVQQLLDDKGMEHIYVSEEYQEPSTD